MSITFTAHREGRPLRGSALFLNFANASAAVIWRVLSLPESSVFGEAQLELLAILVAPMRSELASMGLPSSDAPSIEYERGRGRRGARLIVGQLSPDGVARRVERLGVFLDAARAAGADSVSWA